MKIIGVLMILLGIAGLFAGGITWTDRDKVVDLGPLEVTTEERERLPLPPLVGAASLIGGVVLLVAASRRPTAS